MMPRPTRPIALVLGLLLASLAGCASQPTSSRVAAEQERRLAAEQVARNRKMHVAFGHIQRIKKDLLASDLDHARAEAEAMQAARFDDSTPGWTTYADTYGKAVTEVAQAGDLDAAAAATTRLAMVCGQCHAAERIDLGLGIPDRPKGTSDPWGKKQSDEEIHMRVHAWGVDRMWESLMTSSNDMWTAGVSAFVEQEPEDDGSGVPKGVKFGGQMAKESKKKVVEKPKRKPRSPERQAWVDRIESAIAPLVAGSGPTDPPGRAQMLGDILGACGGCHQLPPPEKEEKEEDE